MDFDAASRLFHKRTGDAALIPAVSNLRRFFGKWPSLGRQEVNSPHKGGAQEKALLVTECADCRAESAQVAAAPFPGFQAVGFSSPRPQSRRPLLSSHGQKKSRRFLCENSCSLGLYSVVGLVVCSTNGNYAKTT